MKLTDWRKPQMPKDNANPSQTGPQSTPKKRRNTVRINQKRIKLLEGIAQGMNVSEAGRAAGYSHAQSAHEAVRRMENFIPDVLNRIGCPIEKVLKKLDAKLDAKETKFFSNGGIVTDSRQVEAHDIQIRAATELAKMHHAYPRSGADGDEDGSRPRGPSFTLVITDPAVADRVVEKLAVRRGGRGQPSVDEGAHKDEG
jgi:hypothetical protein